MPAFPEFRIQFRSKLLNGTEPKGISGYKAIRNLINFFKNQSENKGKNMKKKREEIKSSDGFWIGRTRLKSGRG